MPYIPKGHEKYNLLPICRIEASEVFDYPSELMHTLSERGIEGLEPYGYQSYEEYYAYLDKKRESLREASDRKLLDNFKRRVIELNNKDVWSVLKYVGDDIDAPCGLTRGRYYYWPCLSNEGVYRGVIDDEEFTAYEYTVDSACWEIVEDPTGMASRTLR